MPVSLLSIVEQPAAVQRQTALQEVARFACPNAPWMSVLRDLWHLTRVDQACAQATRRPNGHTPDLVL